MNTKTPKRLSSVKNLPSRYPDAGFSVNSIRWLIFNAKDNGFHQCIRRAGRKVLIDLDEFEQWLDEEAIRGSQS